MTQVKKRLLLLGVSCLLLVVITVFITVAWYTRMVSTAGMEFEVAQWEFSANEMIDDFTVNIYQYSHVLQDSAGNTMVAAPGTAGYIPITLSLGDSEVDIEYYVTVDKTSMSDEFQERIFFYYLDENDEEAKLQLFNGVDDLTGIITLTEKTEEINIYWEWVYEVTTAPDGEAYTQTEIDANNEFDTKVGKNPDDYESDMIATVQIYGVQVEPDSTDAVNVFG